MQSQPESRRGSTDELANSAKHSRLLPAEVTEMLQALTYWKNSCLDVVPDQTRTQAVPWLSLLQPPGPRAHESLNLTVPTKGWQHWASGWIQNNGRSLAFCPPCPWFSHLIVQKLPSWQEALDSDCGRKLLSCFWASTGPRGWRDASGWHCNKLAHRGPGTLLGHVAPGTASWVRHSAERVVLLHCWCCLCNTEAHKKMGMSQ